LDILLIVIVPIVHLLAMADTHAAETGNFAGLVDIGSSRKMYLKCSGRGSPTVVLVGGWIAKMFGRFIARFFAARPKLAMLLRDRAEKTVLLEPLRSLSTQRYSKVSVTF